MTNSQVLEIQNVEERDASDGRKYKYCTVVGYESVTTKHPITGQEITSTGKVVSSALNIWNQAPNNGKMNPDYSLWTRGGFKAGMIVTKEVMPYEVEGRTVSTATVVVIGDSTSKDWEARVNLEFKNRGFSFPTNEVKEKTPALAEDFKG